MSALKTRLVRISHGMGSLWSTAAFFNKSRVWVCTCRARQSCAGPAGNLFSGHVLRSTTPSVGGSKARRPLCPCCCFSYRRAARGSGFHPVGCSCASPVHGPEISLRADVPCTCLRTWATTLSELLSFFF